MRAIVTVATLTALVLVPVRGLPASGGQGRTDGDTTVSPLGAERLSDMVERDSQPRDEMSWCSPDSASTVPCHAVEDAAIQTDVIPEPATMTLLATGLLGMAAASARRRRQERK